MNKTELSAIMLIVKKLSWNDMPARVAIPAIQRMVNNDIAVSLDCCGFQDEPEDALLSIATMRPVNSIWMRLFIHDYQSLHDEPLKHWALSNRTLIEEWMKAGVSFEDACASLPSKEWEWEQYQNYLNEMPEASLKYSF